MSDQNPQTAPQKGASASPPARKGGVLGGPLIPAVAAIALGIGGSYMLFGRPPEHNSQVTSSAVTGCILQPPSRIGGPISLQSDANQPVTQATFAGSPTLVYFGFTHCPDICPNSMYLIHDALNLMGASGQSVKTALVTVDPERDTPEDMHDYIATEGFPRGLVGLTGTPDQIAAAAQAFAVSYQKVQQGDDYTMSHTSFVYLMDGNWRTQAVMSTIGRTPQELASCLSQGLQAKPPG
ncbi:MAG: SCO family protein [Hyphomonadaceae bacterium]|nr:SCO family protein [Hyphomonadaceae bacterium]